MEIPRGFEVGRQTAATVGEASNIVTPAQAAGPYAAASRSAAAAGSSLQPFVDAAKADQDLNDKIMAFSAAADVDAAVASARGAINESGTFKGNDGKDHTASDYLDPEQPWKGTYGGNQLKKFADETLAARIEHMPKKQQQYVKVISQPANAKHIADLESKMFEDRGIRLADTSIKTVRAIQDPQQRRDAAAGFYKLGSININQRVALDAETNKIAMDQISTGFAEQERSGSEWKNTREQINADPYALPEDKDKALAEVDSWYFGRSKRYDSQNWDANQNASNYLSTLNVNGQLTIGAVQALVNNHQIEPRLANEWVQLIISRKNEDATIKDDNVVVTSFLADIDDIEKSAGDPITMHQKQLNAEARLLQATRLGQINPLGSFTKLKAMIHDAADYRYQNEDFKDAMRYMTRIITNTEADSISQLLTKITLGDDEALNLYQAQSDLKEAMKRDNAEPLSWMRENVLHYTSVSKDKTLAMSKVPTGTQVGDKPVYGSDGMPDLQLYSVALHRLVMAHVLDGRQENEALRAAHSWFDKHQAGLREEPKPTAQTTSQPANRQTP